MRNLTLLSSTVYALQDVELLKWCSDPESDVVYVCGRIRDSSAVGIWLCSKSSPEKIAQVSPEGDSSTLPVVVAFNFLSELQSLCVVFQDGRIVTVSLDDTHTVSTVGDVDHGLQAAAWSPDESLVVMITGDNKMLLMTQDYDVIIDAFIQTDDFGEEQAINVGWGSKTTQFHGSLGKTAAQQANDVAALASRGSTSPDDDLQARISWRGDGSFYSVSSVDSLPGTDGSVHRRRVVRVYNSLGALQTTSEPVPGLEHTLSWRPSGSLIASTQRFGFPGGGAGRPDRHDVVFFERNGLRHGEFALRESPRVSAPEWNYKVRELSWSSDSSVLAVWIQRRDCDAVQLWTTGNYHWYLKIEIEAQHYGEGKFSSVAWHPEDPLRIILTTQSHVVDYRLGWDTCASRTTLPFDTGMVAVIDGTTVNLTPFRTQNIPPPMSSFSLICTQTAPPIHVSLSGHSDVLCGLWANGVVLVWELNTTPVLQGGKSCAPRLSGEFKLCNDIVWRQCSVLGEDCGSRVCALGTSRKTGMDVLHILGTEKALEISLPQSGGRLVDGGSRPIWSSPTGDICAVDLEMETAVPACTLPDRCLRSVCLSDAENAFVGLNARGSLFAVCEGQKAVVLATNCSSFTVTPGFLVYITTSHEAVFVQRSDLLARIMGNSTVLPSETRRVERGSRVVTAVPSAMSLVLQMPRGNLETIYPRPFVLDATQKLLKCNNYKSAFVSCRKHRIDLNILVDYDKSAFMQNIPLFVDQVGEVDHLNLFLAGLGRSQQNPDSIGELCDAIRLELESRDFVKYVNAILTAHVVKTPPDYEAALSVLLRLRDNQSAVVEEAAKYVIFLVDAERMLNTALGMYDFSLFLLIAQFSQKDPREYLPFLRELRSFPPAYQRFRIDEHLKRYEKALEHISGAGDERFAEALSFVEKHRLYARALALWPRDSQHHKEILNVYGDYLFERREYAQAAITFVACQRPEKAMVAHERGLSWRELFALAQQMSNSIDDVRETGRRVGEALLAKRRYAEAATVLRDYAEDVEGSVRALVEGNELAEAMRIIALAQRMEFVKTIVHPGALECQAQLIESIAEVGEQLTKQHARIAELKTKKEKDPDDFYGIEETSLHNVDVMTEASAFTTFTRYTKAPTTASGTSRRTSKSKRKLERKANSGRKGTVDEERYLLTSISKLFVRLDGIQAEAAKLLPNLVGFASSEHQEAARQLQQDLTAFENALEKTVEDVWKEEQLVPDESGAMVKIDKPVWEKRAWKIVYFE